MEPATPNTSKQFIRVEKKTAVSPCFGSHTKACLESADEGGLRTVSARSGNFADGGVAIGDR